MAGPKPVRISERLRIILEENDAAYNSHLWAHLVSYIRRLELAIAFHLHPTAVYFVKTVRMQTLPNQNKPHEVAGLFQHESQCYFCWVIRLIAAFHNVGGISKENE